MSNKKKGTFPFFSSSDDTSDDDDDDDDRRFPATMVALLIFCTSEMYMLVAWPGFPMMPTLEVVELRVEARRKEPF